MNSKLVNWLYIIGSILVVGIVAAIAIQLLFWLIPILVVIYLFFKIKGYFSRKKYSNSTSTSYKNTYNPNYSNDFNVSNENNQVIDVEYEDVDNK